MAQYKGEQASDVGEHGLKKHDIKVPTVVFMIFCLVSAGCYGIEEVIPECGPGLTIVMLCVFPFIWGIPFGLVAAELGSVRPQEGGYYKWVQEALGEFWGFQAGWWRTISIYIDMVSYVVLAGGYASAYWDLSTTGEFTFKALMIIIFVFVNIRGVKDVGIVSSILAILVMAAFVMVAICGFINWGEGTNISFQMAASETSGVRDWFFLIAGGISIIMWQYSGYESMSTVAGEIKDPQVIPKATLIAMPLIIATYVIPTIAGLGSLGEWQDWAPSGEGVGYSDVVARFWNPAFGLFFVIVAIMAQCSIYNTYIASGSRGFFTLADDNLAPPVMVKCDKKHGVPYITVLSVGVVSLAFCMVPFGLIIIFDMALLAASYVLVYISAIKLRKIIPKDEYKFRIPGGNRFLYVLCVVPILVALFGFFINGSDYYTGGMLALLSGPVLYFIWRRKYGGLSKKNSDAWPSNVKTGMAMGDTKRIAFLLLIMSIMNVIAMAFLPWYESWGNTEKEWESGDYFDGVLENADVEGLVCAIQFGLYTVTIICAIGCAVLYLISRRVEPGKK